MTLAELLDAAGLTVGEWLAMDEIERRAYARLFGPVIGNKAKGYDCSLDYDGDMGRGARDEMEAQR